MTSPLPSPQSQSPKAMPQPRPRETSSNSSSLLNRFQEPPGQLNEEEQSGMGFGIFLILLVVGILLDIIDLFELSGIGAIIVVAISLALGAMFFMLLYFFDKGDYNLIRQGIAWVMEIIPGFDVLLVNSFAVILSYILSQPAVKKKVRQLMATSSTIKSVAESADKLQRTAKLFRAGK